MKKKLQLKKETIAVLNGDNMRNVVGGENQCRMDADCPADQQCIDGVCIYPTTLSIISVSLPICIPLTITVCESAKPGGCQ